MAYKRKTEDVYEVVYDYGYGAALKSLPSAAQCGKPKPTAKLTLKMNTSAP